jgi:phosphoribosylaminoimidazolecarboxamide formyltransferase/IMP cyclohydrolase
MKKIQKKALLSVSNKTGIDKLAKHLSDLGFQILSTGGTATTLRSMGFNPIDVSEYTGQSEILGGRVKTLHPKIHGGILARRHLAEDTQTVEQEQIHYIDVVVVNLYPFESTIEKTNVTWDEAIEQIDIGGPAMVRASAKNHQDVTIIVDPSDYEIVIQELQDQQKKTGQAQTTLVTRRYLAQKAFAHTARYDAAISQYMSRSTPQTDTAQIDYPKEFSLGGTLLQKLRYGENPHQTAALYRSTMLKENITSPSLLDFKQIQGKELSFNNMVDADAAWGCVRDLAATHHQPACVIIKHANPCGVALGKTPLEAYQKALKTDPTSAFGGIIAFNQPVDEHCVDVLLSQFLEVLIAPSFTEGAMSKISQKPNIRVLQIPMEQRQGLEIKHIDGGFLLQSLDQKQIQQTDCRVVSQKQPTNQQWQDMLFAWQVAKWVKSNAIIFVKDQMTIGIGAGQMSRVDSAKIAAIKAEQAGLSLDGAVAASDAFFPFRDGLDVLVKQGACAVISPGGSMRDAEVIAAADEQGAALVFTGIRHFRH